MKTREMMRVALGVALVAAVLTAPEARGCACGCGLFDVGTSTLLPMGSGGTTFLEYLSQDQGQNWSGTSSAPAANNDDKEIRTSFINFGLQYYFNRKWGVMAEVPYANRFFKTTGGASGSDIVSVDWWGVGDLKLNMVYTGFPDDMSSGVTMGLKFPTGDFGHNDAFGDVDRDTELGTGSTDVLLGGFYRRYLTPNNSLVWFGQGRADLPVFTQQQYRPGFEVNAATGLYYTRLHVGRLKISPLAQVIGQVRTSDSGANASNPVASGFQRILVAPGIEFDAHPWRFYADVEFPVFQNMIGNQLVAPALFKCSLSYMF